MRSNLNVLLSLVAMLAFMSCSKKTTPSQTTSNTEIKDDNSEMKGDSVLIINKADSLVATKPVVVKRKPKESVPKVMVVNDKYAKKSVDGRYYYDLQGHRYWRSNKDGKYYLFNKSMYSNPDFDPPKN